MVVPVRNFQTEDLRLQIFGLRVHTLFNTPEVPLCNKILGMYPSHTIIRQGGTSVVFEGFGIVVAVQFVKTFAAQKAAGKKAQVAL